jgi:hypothetical protein
MRRADPGAQRKRNAKPEEVKKSSRLNLLIHPELREWVHQYAGRKHTSVSAIITEHLVLLREQEHVLNVEQI